jgi:hypothetical protein
MSWKEKITDENERAVFQALDDPKWDFRTVSGITRTTSIPEENVREIIARYPDLIRKSAVPDHRGQELYTLRSRPISATESAAMMRAFLAKTGS